MTNAAGKSTAAVGSADISSGFMKTNPESGARFSVKMPSRATPRVASSSGRRADDGVGAEDMGVQRSGSG